MILRWGVIAAMIALLQFLEFWAGEGPAKTGPRKHVKERPPAAPTTLTFPKKDKLPTHRNCLHALEETEGQPLQPVEPSHPNNACWQEDGVKPKNHEQSSHSRNKRAESRRRRITINAIYKELKEKTTSYAEQAIERNKWSVGKLPDVASVKDINSIQDLREKKEVPAFLYCLESIVQKFDRQWANSKNLDLSLISRAIRIRTTRNMI